jgi:hypothetical protein
LVFPGQLSVAAPALTTEDDDSDDENDENDENDTTADTVSKAKKGKKAEQASSDNNDNADDLDTDDDGNEVEEEAAKEPASAVKPALSAVRQHVTRVLSKRKQMAAARLMHQLRVLSLFTNGQAFVQPEAVQVWLLQTLLRPDEDVQQLALKGLCAFKPFRVVIKPQLVTLNTITATFKSKLRDLLQTAAASLNALEDVEQRARLQEVLHRLLLAKMFQRKGKSHYNPRDQRRLILRFLASASEGQLDGKHNRAHMNLHVNGSRVQLTCGLRSALLCLASPLLL